MRLRRAVPAMAFAAALAWAGGALAEGRVLIYNFDGQSSIVRNRKTIPMDLDMPLKENDLVRTEAESFADIAMNGVLGARVMAGTDCRVLNTNDGNMVLALDNGALLVNMKTLSSGSTFRIDTPTVTALVRDTTPGTQFLVRVRKSDSGGKLATIIAKKNTIYAVVGESSVTISVLEDQAIDVPEGSVIPPVRLPTEEEDNAASRALSVYVADTD